MLKKWVFINIFVLSCSSLPLSAAEIQGGLCFPETAGEIVEFYRSGHCPGVKRESKQTKGLGGDDKGIKIAPDRAGVLFDYDKAEIKPDFHALLAEWAAALRELRDMRFIIAGHTDYLGGERYNQALSERRAAAVRNFLIQRHGIAPERLLLQGFGETRPLRGDRDDQTDAERAWNRRVEFTRLRAAN